jgi:hypothetical protein
MAKKQQKQSYDITRIVFSVSYLVVTLTALIFTLVICAKPFRITEVAHLKQVNMETYNTQNHDEYYVFVYGDNDSENEWYSDLIIQYSNQARTTDTVLPIYGYDSSKKKQGALVTNLSLSDVPALLYIKSGSVNKKITNWADIRNTLTDAMNPSDPHAGHNHE